MSLYKCNGIYKIECRKNHKVYIGFTSENFGDRRDCHFASLRKGYHYNTDLQNDFDKYGESDFSFEIVEVINSQDIEVYKDRERYWIAEFNAVSNGYNVSSGGNNGEGTRPSKAKILQMTESNRILNTGKTATTDTKAKMSAAHLAHHGKPILNKEKVSQIKMRLIQHESINALAREYGVSAACISRINVDKNWKSVKVDGWEDYQKERL